MDLRKLLSSEAFSKKHPRDFVPWDFLVTKKTPKKSNFRVFFIIIQDYSNSKVTINFAVCS